jgi:hypothetical protein
MCNPPTAEFGIIYIHLNLAGALGLRGDLDQARTALAEALRLRPEVNSLARYAQLLPGLPIRRIGRCATRLSTSVYGAPVSQTNYRHLPFRRDPAADFAGYSLLMRESSPYAAGNRRAKRSAQVVWPAGSSIWS